MSDQLDLLKYTPPSADIVSLDGLFDLPVYSERPCRQCGSDVGTLRRSIYNGLIRLTVVCKCGARRGDALSKRELLELIREGRSAHRKRVAGGGGAAWG